MNKPQWPEGEVECSWCNHRAKESMFNKTHSKWCKISSWFLVLMIPLAFLWLIFGKYIIHLIDKS